MESEQVLNDDVDNSETTQEVKAITSNHTTEEVQENPGVRINFVGLNDEKIVDRASKYQVCYKGYIQQQ